MTPEPPKNKTVRKKVAKKAGRGSAKGEYRGGRKPGIPNKNSFLFRMALDDADFNVLEELVVLYRSIDDPLKKLDIITRLIPYLYPQLTAVEPKSLPSQDPLERKNGNESKSALILALKKSLDDAG